MHSAYFLQPDLGYVESLKYFLCVFIMTRVPKSNI